METADTTCALSGSISGAEKSIEIRFRMCGPPLFQLYACCLLNAVVIFCSLHLGPSEDTVL